MLHMHIIKIGSFTSRRKSVRIYSNFRRRKVRKLVKDKWVRVFIK